MHVYIYIYIYIFFFFFMWDLLLNIIIIYIIYIKISIIVLSAKKIILAAKENWIHTKTTAFGLGLVIFQSSINN
jgi:hypothetical protein